MGIEESMYENAQVKLKSRMWVTLAFFFVSGAVSVTYLHLNRPAASVPPPLVTTEGCVKMCGEAGVDTYNEAGCSCKKPPRPVVSNMMCECRERTKEEEAKLNHY